MARFNNQFLKDYHLALFGANNSTLRLLGVLGFFNLPFWMMAHSHLVTRPVFSLDVVLVAFFLPILGPLVGGLLLCFLWLIDVAVVLSATYNFKLATDFILSARFLGALHIASFLSWETTGMVGLFCLCMVVVVRLLKTPVGFIPTLVVGAFLFVADAANGSFQMISRADTQHLASNISGSPLRVIAAQAKSQFFSHSLEKLAPIPESQSLTIQNGILSWPMLYRDRSVLVVIVESFGINKYPEIREWMRSKLITNDIQEKYLILQTASPFRGATVDGELRVLCDLSGQFGAMTTNVGKNCLPSQFAKNGWATHGFHGFVGEMFDRRYWWPQIGLQHVHFVDDLLGPNDPRCGGGFRGACDALVAHKLVPLLSGRSQFVYLLTLNTHFPIEAIIIPQDLDTICSQTHTSSEACQHIASIGAFLVELRKSILAIPTPPAVLVVGDHAPPFSKTRDREMFDNDRVPVFIMTPTDVDSAPNSDSHGAS